MKEGVLSMADTLNKFLECKAAYGKNEKFTEYVNECGKAQGKTVEDILCQATTYEYLVSVKPGGCNEK